MLYYLLFLISTIAYFIIIITYLLLLWVTFDGVKGVRSRDQLIESSHEYLIVFTNLDKW